MLDPVTREGRYVADLWTFLLVAATGVAVVVLGLLAIATIRGTRRGAEDLPPQRHGNLALEFTFITGAAALSAVIFGLGLWYQARIDDDPPTDLEVAVQGYQWGWRFEYPGGRVVASEPGRDPVLVLPVDQTVTFHLRSDDVIHSFFVPAFAWKQDLIPGRPMDLTVTPDKEGRHVAHCAELCGIDHARMNFAVDIVSADAFDRWLATGEGAGDGAVPDVAEPS
ncbi:MAG: cytochrome c oxidase subunit II [Acidimicrobiales bacterium]